MAANSAGLQIIDVSNVAAPTPVGSYDTPGYAHDVAISGNYAYVADGLSGLQIIDVSNVNNPTLASSYDTPDYAYDVAISGNYAYVADDNSGLQIIDLACPTSSTSSTPFTSTTTTSSSSSSSTTTSSSSSSSSSTPGPTGAVCPQLVGSYDTPSNAAGVAVSGNYAYVAAYDSGLQIIDVTNVTNPIFAGFYDTPDYALDVVVFGDYAYVGDMASGLWIIDVSNVTNPALAGFCDAYSFNIVVSGNYAYVVGASGLQIIDVSNVTNPTLAGFHVTPSNTYDVAVSGNYAYVTDWISGLQIIDVSNVTNPMLAGSYDTPSNALGVAVSGNYAYVTDEASGLLIIDVSNVAVPTFVGSYDTPGQARGVVVSGDYAYVADRDSGLQILDVSNVTNPTLVDSYDTPGSAFGVAISGNYAYVADDNSGLQIVDLACPTTSTTTSSTTTSSSITTSTTTSTASTSSHNPTTTTISSSTTIPIGETSTGSSSSRNTTNPTHSSTTIISSSTLFSTQPSTTIFTTTEDNRSSDFNNFPWIWLALLAGGAVCLGLFGGGVAIILRRRKERLTHGGASFYWDSINRNEEGSNSEIALIERGSKTRSDFKMKPTKTKGHAVIGGEYYQLNIVTKKEAQEIYQHTGHLITFPPDTKKIKYVIGKGNFGAIKVAQRIEDEEYVASKKVKGEANMKASVEEANMQREAAGENILSIYNTTEFENALYHFMPLAGYGSGKDIQDQLAASSNPALTLQIMHFVAKDVLTGLKTIHAKGIYHLDMKPENVVFTKDGIAYITDFGCAKKTEERHAPMPFNALGDNKYFSPERIQVARDQSLFDGEKSDVWSTGILLLQMVKNTPPLNLFGIPNDLHQRVRNCTPDFFREKLTHHKELQEAEEGSIWWIFKRLLDPNPETRFTAEQALQAPCFKGVDKVKQAAKFEELKIREQAFYDSQQHQPHYVIMPSINHPELPEHPTASLTNVPSY